MNQIEIVKKFIDENSHKIWIDNVGRIVYDSIFEREFEKLGGDISVLHSAIEDNIHEIDEDGELIAMIDWIGVMKAYVEIEEECNRGTI